MNRNRNEKGTALLTTLVIVTLLAGMGAAFATYLFSYVRSTEQMMRPVMAKYGAEAAIEKIWNDISHSTYTNGVNDWLSNAIGGGPHSTAAPGTIVMDNVPYGRSKVRVRMVDLATADRRHLCVAYSWYWAGEPGGVWPPVTPPDAAISQEFQGNISFSSFAFLTSNQDLSFSGNVNIRGGVQSNKKINFYSTFMKTFYKDVKAVQGFTYGFGGAPGNTTILGNAVQNATQIDLPSNSIIADLKNQAPDGDTPYNIHTKNGLNDVFLTFGVPVPGKIGVTVKNKISGVIVYSATNLDPPPSGIFFTQGDLHIVGGDTSSRITVVCANQVYVDGSIRIVDGQGDPAAILTLNGVPVDPNAQPPGVAFTTANGYVYDQNVAYDNNPTTRGALGIISHFDVSVTANAPYNMELMAAILAINGNFNCDTQVGTVKGNLMTLGSFATKNAGKRYQPQGGSPGYSGWGLTGNYVFDDGLALGPPPQFPGATQAGMGVRWSITRQELVELGLWQPGGVW